MVGVHCLHWHTHSVVLACAAADLQCHMAQKHAQGLADSKLSCDLCDGKYTCGTARHLQRHKSWSNKHGGCMARVACRCAWDSQ